MKTEKKFQGDIVNAILAHFNAAHRAYGEAQSPELAEPIRQEHSAVLLEAPTGVGKTYMACRAIGKFSQHKKMLWFWFSPWEHLADQTEACLRMDAHGLRVSDLTASRHAAALAGSRVYSLVWASLAARADVRRKTREADDGKQDLATFVAEARSRGYRIGVVIDEAHHGISGETEATRLLRDTLCPDYHLFVTATPDDKDLQSFQKSMGITRIRREVASRDDGIEAGLIKPDVKVVYFEETDDTAGYLTQGVPLENAAIAKAVALHNSLKVEIALLDGVSLTPLLLVQVGSASTNAESDAKAALVAAGLPESAIRIHTANKPDRDLQKIANDQSVEALIFKMAVATGFDAPRAFTLMSMRTTRSEQFGLQVLGRILRVPAELQALPKGKIPSKLQHGYVFLVDKTSQDGLTAAADRIASIRRGVSELCIPSSLQDGLTGEDLLTLPCYAMRTSLSVPQLWTQDNVFDISDDVDLEQLVATQVAVDSTLLEAALLDQVTFGTTVINVFGKNRETSVFGNTTEDVNFRGIARKALAQLGSIPETDLRGLLLALSKRLSSEFEQAGHGQVEESRLHHAVNILGQIDPKNPVREALRRLRTWSHTNLLAEPLPDEIESEVELSPSVNNIYGVLPRQDSPEENRFVQGKLDDEDSPVLWWHRNPPRKPSSVGLAKPTGGVFYPDFIVCVKDLQTKDGLALIEVKGEGWLTDSKVGEDFRTWHPEYGRPVFVVEAKGTWFFIEEDGNGGLRAGNRFTWKSLPQQVTAI